MVWNPWHGCTKYSEGCLNCYVYRRDSRMGKDAHELHKNRDFDLPLRLTRDGSYKIAPMSHLYLCMTSDFFLDRADSWRDEIWQIMRARRDLSYTIITKRIERFSACIPPDWGEGWDNVTIACTVENQRCADIRLPIFLSAPIKRKMIVCEPLLGEVALSPYLESGEIKALIAGGESGESARLCDYRWVLSLREQCVSSGVPFRFKQTGTFFQKDGRTYRILRKHQSAQAKKAGIDTADLPL